MVRCVVHSYTLVLKNKRDAIIMYLRPERSIIAAASCALRRYLIIRACLNSNEEEKQNITSREKERKKVVE